MHRSKKFQLVLGSQSPRRKELLKWIYVPYKIVVSDIEEKSTEKNSSLYVQDIAFQKANAVYKILLQDKSFDNPFVIGADTIVVLNDEILGKPKNRADAKRILSKLMGKQHQVITGVSFVWGGGEYRFYDETKVKFDVIDDALLELYLDTNESLDKAGAYGIQGAALGFIDKIEGSYSNVVGLPVNLVMKNLIKVLEQENDTKWREQFEI